MRGWSRRRAAARHVARDHGVDRWHAQEITVEYERYRAAWRPALEALRRHLEG